MSKVAIVIDSTAYLPDNFVQQYNISVAPLLVNWDEQSYQDGVDIKPFEFYERLKKSKSMPSSSQVPVAVFEKIFKQLLDQGSEILTITISSGLSGTFDSALQAKASFSEAPIEVVDSLGTCGKACLEILAAARAADEGAELAECKAIAEQARANSGLILTLETLEFLYRGGRIGGGARFLGTALNIKPILEVVEGKLEAVERVRTRKKAISRTIELVGERIAGLGANRSVRLFVVHANAEAEARATLDAAKEKFHAVEANIAPVSPVIGVHVGPGTIGLSYQVE